MITSPAFAGKRYAVLGLARSGAAAAEALIASGAEVIAWDRQPHAREPFEGRCRLIDPLELDLTGFAGVVVSPGVPLGTKQSVQHMIADSRAEIDAARQPFQSQPDSGQQPDHAGLQGLSRRLPRQRPRLVFGPVGDPDGHRDLRRPAHGLVAQ